ncbi:MAG: hypothetical protein V1873_00955 [Verrucomicrobiota bacterium]
MRSGACIRMLFLWLVPVLAQAWTPDQIDFPGNVQGWVLTLDSSKYTGPDGSTEWFRYTATASSSTNNYEFKMVTSNSWDNDYGGNTSFPKNECAILWYQPLGDSNARLLGGATNAYRYVFTTKDPGLVDTHISIMELSADPVGIASATGGTGSFQTNEGVVITITLATNPPPEQKVYVRYTTDSWTSAGVVQATITSNMATAVVTNLAMATTYEWYALASTASSNYLAHTNSFSVDALTLSWANNSGSNYEFGTPGDAAWLWHNNNRVIYGGSNVEFWVKIGYCNGDGSDRWITNAAIYYTTDGSTPTGSYGVASGTTTARPMQFNHVEADSSLFGEAMWWVGTVSNLPGYTTVKYKIGAWYEASRPERFADYGTSGTNNAVFSFALGVLGDPELTVGGLNANYTTTKRFIDEIAGETQAIVVVFKPGVSNLDKVEIFSNLDRRDYCDVDYTNAFLSGDGYPDGIRPPAGRYLSTNDVGAYFRAYAMAQTAAGEYTWTGTVSRCGAYRLTGRFTTNGMAANEWRWCGDYGQRDHAIVVSPRKVHALTMYELNTLTVESTDSDEAHRSTFRDLLSAGDSGGDTNGFDPFNLDYLNFIQANCLWFQPIHPNAQERKDAYTPGSPYASRNYFAVSRYMGSDGTEAGAMTEFTNFVATCDVYTGSVGSIHVVLDGVFNHTAWDAVFGVGGTNFNFCTNVNDRIGWFRPTWYSYWQDYGTNATYYHSAYSNDIATAPDRGDFGKWFDVADLFFGRYSALVRHNPDNNGDYLNEGDVYDFDGMVTTNEMDLWRYFAYYTEFWLKKTGHAGTNSWVEAQDERGIDGLRCDFGQGLPPQMWEYIINRTRKMKWNFIFMAETLDGGVPGYRSNRHFDILNENLVFKFTQEHVNDSWAVRQALEDRRTIYNGGTVLLNLTSHDEVLPDNDCWLVASRYGALSAVDGIPMVFYGQEQGIQNYNPDPSYWYYDGFRTDHEVNFGKAIPHFKQWNQLVVWSNAPPDNTGLAQWYGRVNWARLNSPALQSPNRYFLSKVGGGDEGKILAVAKYEAAYASPRTSDVVLAFALLFRHGEAHAGASATYNLQPAWSLLGLDTGRYYNVRNLASSDASKYVWGSAQSGADLWNNGVFVGLNGGTGGAITNDGELVQHLKIEEINQAPQIGLPGPHTLPVGAATNFGVSASDSDGDSVILTNTVAPAGATFNGTSFAWTALPTNFANTTSLVVFVADDQRGATNSLVTNSTTITVPFDWDGDGMGDGWEWGWFTTLLFTATADYDSDSADNGSECIAGTQPTDSNSVFKVRSIVTPSGQTNRLITVPTVPAKHYVIYFGDGNLTNSMAWSKFADTNNGIGTWTETNLAPTTHTFTDDEGPNTTLGGPATGRRFYRLTVQNP